MRPGHQLVVFTVLIGALALTACRRKQQAQPAAPARDAASAAESWSSDWSAQQSASSEGKTQPAPQPEVMIPVSDVLQKMDDGEMIVVNEVLQVIPEANGYIARVTKQYVNPSNDRQGLQAPSAEEIDSHASAANYAAFMACNVDGTRVGQVHVSYAKPLKVGYTYTAATGNQTTIPRFWCPYMQNDQRTYPKE